MPSPFPGMDPFIEGQRWEDFHHEFLSEVRAALVVQVRPRYDVRIEERVYIEYEEDEGDRYIEPDLTVVEGEEVPTSSPAATRTMVAVAIGQVLLTLPMPRRRREAFLTVRDIDTGRVITVAEVLSPANKTPGSGKRSAYLEKRAAVLASPAHLVEIDLLRGGRRLPTVEPLPRADYYAFICRKESRPKAEVYFWSLRRPLPSLPIPLADPDADVWIDLQQAFNGVYERAGYDYGIKYRREIKPPIAEADRAWVRERLGGEEDRAASPVQT